MTAIVRTESRRILRSTLLLGGLLLVITIFILSVYPGVREEAETLEEALPAYMVGLLGVEELTTIEGFTAGWVFPMIWVLLIGLFFAYSTASMISADISTRRMDLTLSNPVSRESVVIQKFAALWVPLLVLNGLLFAMLIGGSAVIGEQMDLAALAMAQLLSIPYLLVCGSIGLLVSVLTDRVNIAQAGAIGIVFVLYLLEGVADLEPDYEPLGWIAPSWYYDPSAIMVREEYAYGDAAILLVFAAMLVAVSVVIFTRRDI